MFELRIWDTGNLYNFPYLPVIQLLIPKHSPQTFASLGVAVNQWFSRIWLDFILLDKIYVKQYNWISLLYMYFILTSPPPKKKILFQCYMYVHQVKDIHIVSHSENLQERGKGRGRGHQYIKCFIQINT